MANKCLVLLSICALATAMSSAQSTPGTDQVPIVTVQGTIAGPRTAVFVTPQDSCSPNDIPDAMARAFRDSSGTIHLVSASSIMYQSLGPSLDNLERSCSPAFVSANDGNPADYNDEIWLDSFYTLDGRTIAALSHTEYHGWSFAGECNSQNINQCEYDSDTYHQSEDGGYHFESFAGAKNFLAGVPYEYIVDDGPVGYSVDTNVINYGGWYYAVATDDGSWPPNCGGSSDPCLIQPGGAPIRTKNVFDPTSWRGWSGTDFSVQFVDPYLVPVQNGRVQNPEAHVYAPVPYMQYVNGIYIYQPANVVIATLWDYWDNALGAPGLYITTSTDLVHWSKPTPVVSLAQLLAWDPNGSWLYAYFSLIDPAAPDLNFSIVGNHPYLYYVRLDNNSQGRVLFRQRLNLSTTR